MGAGKTCALWVAILKRPTSQWRGYQKRQEEIHGIKSKSVACLTLPCVARPPPQYQLYGLFRDARTCACVVAHSCKPLSSQLSNETGYNGMALSQLPLKAG